MDYKAPFGLILLTYKGKALLMYKFESAIDMEKHEWTFIRSARKNKESFKEALLRTVKKEAGINVENIEAVSENFFHAKLTDENVNQIKRSEGQLLDFFTLSDLQKLRLNEATKSFAIQFGNLI